MKQRECYIVGAGDFDGKLFNAPQNSYIIAADGGYAHLRKISVTPDIVLGDFDSLKTIPSHPKIIRYPVVKDETDMMIAVKKVLDEGYNLIKIYGGCGGRLDHTLANMQVLDYISKHNAIGFLYGNDCVITAITDSGLSFSDKYKGRISVFPHCDIAKGIYLENLKYKLTDAQIDSSNPLGVSNEFIEGKPSRVYVGQGTLVVMWFDNFDLPLPVQNKTVKEKEIFGI